MVHRVPSVGNDLNYNSSGRMGYNDRPSHRFSLSGNERNHLFMSVEGRRYVDASGVSGADDPGDARAFALLDYDRDGWIDFAVMNANRPAFRLFRNDLGRRERGNSPNNHFVALRFVGANRTARPSFQASNRDGVGARYTVKLDELTVVDEHRAGEGFATQNSATRIVGIGPRDAASSITVRWPSGVERVSGAIPAGALVTAYEDASHSPNGEHFAVETYRKSDVRATTIDREDRALPLFQLPIDASGPPARLRLYTAMATWCPNCRRELPEWTRVRRAFSREELAMFGVPVDDADTAEALAEYAREHGAAYEMLADLDGAGRARMRQAVEKHLYTTGIPATVVTDRHGRILYFGWAAPTISAIHRLLAQTSPLRATGTPPRDRVESMSPDS